MRNCQDHINKNHPSGSHIYVQICTIFQVLGQQGLVPQQPHSPRVLELVPVRLVLAASLVTQRQFDP